MGNPVSLQTRNVEIADILRQYLPLYCKTHKVDRHQFKVLNSIINCRTARLGGHIDKCDHCQYLEISYNSCRDRHCPKCHGSKQAKWLANQIKHLLPIPYFHTVFTLPHSLNNLFICNKKILYDHFFKTAVSILNQFAADPKYFGGKIGHIGILHTWGQNLGYHVHLHFIVTGGAISEDKTKWVQKKHNGKYLFPVKAMQKAFRGKFIAGLIKLRNQGKLVYPGELSNLRHPVYFEDFKSKLFTLPWVIYAKKPFAGPEQVIEYLGRYTHRVAISNQRILSVSEKEITFRYKDYRDNSRTKIMKLSPIEFIRRYLQHILPYRFVKIRHGGFHAGGYKTRFLALASLLIKKINKNFEASKKKMEKVGKRIEQKAIISCPACFIGTLQLQKTLTPQLLELIDQMELL